MLLSASTASLKASIKTAASPSATHPTLQRSIRTRPTPRTAAAHAAASSSSSWSSSSSLSSARPTLANPFIDRPSSKPKPTSKPPSNKPPSTTSHSPNDSPESRPPPRTPLSSSSSGSSSSRPPASSSSSTSTPAPPKYSPMNPSPPIRMKPSQPPQSSQPSRPKLSRYDADLVQLGLPPSSRLARRSSGKKSTTYSKIPTVPLNVHPDKREMTLPLMSTVARAATIRRGGVPPERGRPGPPPPVPVARAGAAYSPTEQEQYKAYLAKQEQQKKQQLFGDEQRSKYRRWAWEWFAEGRELKTIGKALARFAADPKADKAVPIAPHIVAAWILKHLSPPLTKGASPTELSKPNLSDGTALASKEEPSPSLSNHLDADEEVPVCARSPTNAHAYHLLTPTLWSRLTDHLPEYQGRSFAETIGKDLEARIEENRRVWSELWARGWRGEGLKTDLSGKADELARVRGEFDEAGISQNGDIDVDVEVLKRMFIGGEGQEPAAGYEASYEPETVRIERLLAWRNVQRRADQEKPQSKQFGQGRKVKKETPEYERQLDAQRRDEELARRQQEEEWKKVMTSTKKQRELQEQGKFL